MTSRRSRVFLQAVALVGAGAGLTWALTVPLSTRQGVDFQVSTRTIPFYVKAVDFLHRHYQYELLAREITQGLQTDRERVLAIFEWTRQHIPPTPNGWPIMDDHILHIIIRGHGSQDQMADVFTTLTTYAGDPAFWEIFRAPGTPHSLILSFVRVDGRWAVFDVLNGFAFTTGTGAFAIPEALAADPALVRATAGAFQFGGGPYERYFTTLASVRVPRILRAELQMPWPRFWYEVRRLLGWERRHGA